MKKISLLVLTILLGVSLNAQHVFNKGSLLFNAGIGLGSYNGAGWIPSVNVAGEYGVIPTGDIGLVSFGGIVEYKYSSWAGTWVNTKHKYNYHQVLLGPRAIWHVHAFNSDKFDAYGGVGAGVRFWTQYTGWDPMAQKYTSKAKVSPYGEVFVGGRMMFSEALGLFAEVGYSPTSILRFGVTFGF
jgi:hypothetical protein